MGDRGGVTFGKLMMSQFRSQTKAGKNKTLLHEASKIVGSGHVEVPKWFEPLSNVKPSNPFISGMKPQQIVYPEDKLIRAYYNRHPTAKFLPIDLQSKQPHFIRNFANRQLKVMRRMRCSEKHALSVVEEEARDEDRRAKEAEAEGRRFTRHLTPTHTLTTNHIEAIQAEEELAWRATLDEQRQAMFEKLQEKLEQEQGAEYGYLRDEEVEAEDRVESGGGAAGDAK